MKDKKKVGWAVSGFGCLLALIGGGTLLAATAQIGLFIIGGFIPGPGMQGPEEASQSAGSGSSLLFFGIVIVVVGLIMVFTASKNKSDSSDI